MRLTLRHLRYFMALVETGHFGRAARAVGVTQPALSARIAELERITGLRLAERHARGARITDAGRDVAARAVRILAASSEMEAMADAYGGDLVGEMRLGVIPSVAPFAVGRLLRGAAAAGLRPVVRETITERLLDELEEGALDAVLASVPLERPGVAHRDVLRDRFVLAVPPGTEGRPDDRPPLVLLEEGHCLRDQVLAWCGAEAPAPGRGVASLQTLVELVSAGACTTLLPEMVLRDRPEEARRIGTVPLPDPPPERRIVLAWRRTDPRGAQLDRLAARIAEWLGGEPSPAASASEPRPGLRFAERATGRAESEDAPAG